MKTFTVSKAVTALMLAGLVLLPLYSQASGNIFILTLFTRIVILALAAASLNLIMGFGGMMSFGHAAYLGIGGYAVGMLAQEGVGSGFIQFPVALAGLRDLRAGDRRALPAHPRRLFHHDHARLRADGLLRRLGAGALRRR
ncbi:ABC-type branched-subunit amino acid transport system permease subunit [Bradyrhizobium sp. LM6.10]